MNKCSMYNLDKVAMFPIGSPFSVQLSLNEPPKYGWITGLDIKGLGELVFRCRYAHRPSDEAIVHPAKIHPVNKDWDGSREQK